MSFSPTFSLEFALPTFCFHPEARDGSLILAGAGGVADAGVLAAAFAGPSDLAGRPPKPPSRCISRLERRLARGEAFLSGVIYGRGQSTKRSPAVRRGFSRGHEVTRTVG